MKVGLIAKKTKEALETLKLIEDYFVKKKIEVFYDDELLDVLKKDKIMWNEKNLDFVIWLGGDGTLLLHVNKLVNYDAKLLGIKFGNIGFLCEIDPTNIQEKLDRILSGKFRIEKRRLIEFVYDKKKVYALNDVLVTVSNVGKVSNFRVIMGDIEIFSGKCDGIIFSTSIGSTAYIASKGGPIIDPNLETLIVDPINPLRWGSRTLILPFDVSLEVFSDRDYVVIADGNIKFNIKSNEYVKIKGSDKSLSFIRFSNSFYRKIKLRSMIDI